MTTLSDGWFTEVFQNEGTAFSLKVKAKLHEEKVNISFWKSTTPRPSAN